MVFGLSLYRHAIGCLPRKQRPVSAMGRDTGMGVGLQTVGASGDRLVLQVRQEGQEIRERPAGHGGLSNGRQGLRPPTGQRSEEHTSELQSLMRISYAVFCLKKKKNNT